MGTQLIGDFGAHPYAPVLFGLTGLDYSNKGGFAFYDQRDWVRQTIVRVLTCRCIVDQHFDFLKIDSQQILFERLK